jgi:hypothetical protein
MGKHIEHVGFVLNNIEYSTMATDLIWPSTIALLPSMQFLEEVR